MNNDTALPLGDIRAQSNESFSSSIIRIQKAAELIQPKVAMRLCVQVDLSKPVDLDGTDPIELRHHHSDEYIAVSCPWSLPGHDAISGRYRFMPEQPPGVIMASDGVLRRILNFKLSDPDYRHTPFWVDKLCIDQQASNEKETAVHSMDLVYQYSGRKVTEAGVDRGVGCSLGLLYTKIETLEQLTMLRSLLDSGFSRMQHGEPDLLVPLEDALPVLDLIEMILADNWWHRAWIFQEEFLASRHMVLLLPCTLDRGGLYEVDENGIDLYGKTQGEVQVRPLNFRTEVTVFCLALCRYAEKTVRNRCSEILKRARRYTFLYRSSIAAGPNSIVHSMSPAIFEDINARGITVPSDCLAIAANCCRYISRLDAKVLTARKESLSLSVLALFVMNGEILRHDAELWSIWGQSALECLRAAKLPIPAPVESGELIFIKMCRLPTVRIDVAGLTVRGVLSRLDKKLKVKISATDESAYRSTHEPAVTISLTDAERRILLVLAGALELMYVDGGRALPVLLREVAKETKQAQYWTQQHVQVMMAKGVVRAIVEGRPLWLSRLHVPKKWTPWLGVFVPEDEEEDMSGRVSFMFTAAQTDNELKDRGAKLARRNSRVTSLEVRWNPAKGEIVPRRWMNGLSFFNNKEQPSSLVIPWPKWMQ